MIIYGNYTIGVLKVSNPRIKSIPVPPEFDRASLKQIKILVVSISNARYK